MQGSVGSMCLFLAPVLCMHTLGMEEFAWREIYVIFESNLYFEKL